MKLNEYWKKYVILNPKLSGVNCVNELYYNNDDYNDSEDCEFLDEMPKMITIVSKRHFDNHSISDYSLDELFIQFILEKYDIYEEMEEVYDEEINGINILDLLKAIGFELIYNKNLTADNF